MAKNELLNYVAQFDHLIPITEAYRRSCVKLDEPIPVDDKRQTIYSPTFRTYVVPRSSKGASTQLLFFLLYSILCIMHTCIKIYNNHFY